MSGVRKWITAVLLAALPATAGAQGFTKFEPPTDVCAGGATTLTYGFGHQNHVRLDAPVATQNHAGRAFLPDGVPCGEYGCSYRSPVTFTDFAPSARITSVQDIKYVRLNIEHSFIGDIYIGITCPGGRRATIMHFGGNTTSSCQGVIPGSARGWLSGSNMPGSTWFGIANDTENSSDKCNPNASGNEPGTGWNYCWSDNTASGFRYASDDGIVYRRGHATNGHVDSSNVAAGSNFYHPDDGFDNLVGCPLNGNWYIEVVDGYSLDNGYIFDWELALDPSLLPNHCALEARTVTGPWVTRLTDSTYRFAPPSTLAADTTVDITFRMITTCGDTIDSVAPIRVHPRYRTDIDTAVCDSGSFFGTTYTHSTAIRRTMASADGCDSVVAIRLTVRFSTHTSVDTCVVENALPLRVGGLELYGPDTVAYVLAGSNGCDSTVRVALCVWRNSESHADTTVCAHELPFAWNGLNVGSAGLYRTNLHTVYGADSTVRLDVNVLPDSRSSVNDTMVENALPATPAPGYAFSRNTDTVIVLTNAAGCDSVIHYTLTVWNNVSVAYDTTVCDPEGWPMRWRGVPFEGAADTMLTLATSHGADSTVRLRLHVEHRYDTAVVAGICAGQTYRLGSATIGMAGHYEARLSTAAGCDSTVRLDLTVYPTYSDTVADTACATQGITFEGRHLSETGTYTARLHTVHGCDSLRTVELTAIGLGLEAKARITPSIVTLENPEFTLCDASSGSLERLWDVDGFASTAERFTHSYTSDKDSIMAMLVAYASDGCTDTLRRWVAIDRSMLIAPNAFTPTLTDNNRWRISTVDVAELEVWIYNRQGLMVVHLEGTDAEWDGRDSSGRLCPQGSYVYTARWCTRTHPDRYKNTKGTILLLK